MVDIGETLEKALIVNQVQAPPRHMISQIHKGHILVRFQKIPDYSLV